MIFVASQADASALNLGKVSIKTIDDVSQETYDVIAAYGNKSFTDDQIIAIDDFLIQLKNLPTYNKFSFCVIPILAPETPFLGDNSVWRDTNPCYDIINKERLIPDGYGGYIKKHGVTKGSNYGKPVYMKFAEPLSINPSIFTIGVGLYINSMELGYIINPLPSMKQINSGASDKSMAIKFDTELTGVPVVSTLSRNETEIHGVMNDKVGSFTGEVKGPYVTNPYDLKYAISVNTDQLCALTFFCKDYMMTEEELLEVNKIFQNLMEALW